MQFKLIHLHSTCILSMGQVSFSAIGSSFQNSLKQLLFWVCSMTNFFLVHCFLDHLLIQQNAKGNCHKNFSLVQYFRPLGTAAVLGYLVAWSNATENGRQMTFYESIFLQQFSMKLLGLLITKHFFSFILGCPQDFNFAQMFHPFSPVSTQPYQNG